MGRKQYNELNGGDKEGSCSNQGDFTQKFGLDPSPKGFIIIL
ncbi:hypothetical protein EV203_1231 [Caldanaerobacter subterraneus]|uniref:Uncharacterized protein n=1 Tax=Caldanaerobacter subterraneus TaxID=911092 RepID=A0A4V2S7I4_9THEO|nr:hypothetical protein EV203_1231 [Caldanaerobacter subterraneus]